MNKKLLAAMIGTALAGSIGAAQADVQLYGQVDVSVDSHTCDSAGCPRYGYTTSQSGLQKGDGSQKMNMNGNFSYFGIKGSEDLGNGLNAIFNVAFAFDPAGRGNSGNSGSGSGAFSNGSSTITDSEKWLGAAGDFGKVRAGTVYTAYKEHAEMIDPFYGTSLAGNMGGLQSATLTNEFVASDFAVSGLNNRTVRYDSPDMNGLSGSAFYTMGHGTTATPPGPSGMNNGNGLNTGNPYGLGGQYKNGGILAFADYVKASIDSNQYSVFTRPSGAAMDDQAWDIGGQYTMGNIAMFGKFETGGLVFGPDQFGASNVYNGGYKSAYLWHLGGSFTMGNTLMYAAFGQGDSKDPLLENSKTRSWTLAVKHSLSVRTSLYAGYNWNRAGTAGALAVNGVTAPDADIKDGHFGVGMNVKF